MASSNVIKTMVSKNKKRFEEGKFNLDLSYITPRIIAMGYPAQDIEKLYRNDARTVLEFLNQRHPGRYKLFNLCRERQYDSAMFEGRVEWEPFEDHKPPRIEQIAPFCRKVHEWLCAHPDNVVAIHCKAGKGRTGVMICCYLLYSGQFATPAEVLAYYGDQRTKDGKGVTIPSQRRYVEYFHRLMGMERPAYRPTNLFLQAITLEPERALENIVSSVHFSVKTRGPTPDASNGDARPVPSLPLLDSEARKQKEHKLMSSRPVEPARRAGDTCLRIPVNGDLHLCGDFKLELLCKPKNKLKPKEKLCWLWLNTFFVAGPAAEVARTERTERMARASSCPEDENGPGQAYPIASSCSDAHVLPGVSNRITLTLAKYELDKGCKDSRLPDSFKMHLSLVRQRGHVTPRLPHASGSDSDSEDDDEEEYPDSGKETTHL
ncbi:phosphatidylinositol 3,4,5-trisphosphate 3-phosphatase and dual-specificity protein phosphatase PTEN-like isoform X2 [Pollicipes pollicipes]|uniref:phosphatidylinositol 3,4,5-trisphosphate 3-phosphatase and dual-specificity protein phosphatase PTEN-like isoform X2 n=1 Tax=Pollicipes pollicipes TaxID=41117 RepID=UPI001884F585|nr:phosphatidylinositol 3,4,5-trisphosphate 3-phosphatase and dual-specificity protein phosphatase PTEN-like isoform X2 [Pollicipes pollicipes]XP_037069699.1 phosphatidylinositol 3,4,5-trisphosphate 3-phosphatase and dual-specificity protein phosphatase PTEN-like isoform X2 [Pollicipes pollicipes]XP_037073301.1 phosphatidylinositol 3,4,5-trisphosphate 3-phosphatase and dual-specificity protein phosphatase PTEN-like isoform X2 [Pollicipes pollicipes]